MLILLATYLYKFHFKARINKWVGVFKKTSFGFSLQAVVLESSASINPAK
jgi:hypothetical protein